MRSKRFSEKQAALILRRAMAMQVEKPELKESGLDLPELIAAGGEMGIDPALIEAAVSELETVDRPMAKIRSERAFVLDRSLQDSDWQTLLPDLRSAFGRSGKVTDLTGGIREWQGGENDLDEIHVSFSPQGDRTLVRASSDHSGTAGLLGIVMALPILGLVATTLNLRELPFWMNLIAATLIAILGYLSYRSFLRGLIVRREAAISKLFERIAKATPYSPELGQPQRETEDLELRLNQP